MKSLKISYIKHFLLALAVMQVCTSCEKLLEVEVPGNQMDAKTVFQDVQTANAALAGLYANIWDNSPLAGGSPGSGVLLGSYTDDLNCYFSSGESSGGLDIYHNLQIASNAAIYMYWESAYKEIYIANAIIEGAENSEALPASERKRIKGEALLIRSILFFYLQQVFGDIPLPINTDYKINQSLPKTPALQVLVKLVSDFKETVNLLSDEYRHTERIFPNRKVTQLMLAKTYMIQRKWNDAEIILKSISSSPLYSFEQDITKVFQKSGGHIIWQLKPKNPNDPTNEIQAFYFSDAAPSLYALTNDLVNSFSENDKRKQNWIMPVMVNQNTWYRVDKYKNRTMNPTEYSVVFRLEEVYLHLAEVLAQQNKLAEALPYLNATRQRAGLPALDNIVSKEVLLDEVLTENRKEFFSEMGHRFMDLKRFGRLNTLQATKPNWKDYHQLWPIPQKELLLNVNLKPQNNEY